MQIVRCTACDGYGWIDDEDDAAIDAETLAETTDGIECRWCGGIGYVYRDQRGIDRRIPESDYERHAAELERLELERLREIGYTGTAKKPWEQAIRQQNKQRQQNEPNES